MATKVVTADFEKEILDVLSTMNCQRGVVSHCLSEIEAHLKERGISYDLRQLSDSIVRLIKEGRITMHVWWEDPHRQTTAGLNQYEPYLVNIMSVV